MLYTFWKRYSSVTFDAFQSQTSTQYLSVCPGVTNVYILEVCL